MEIVYSAQRSGFEPGRVYMNPKYFDQVHPGATRVVIIGNWPKVKRAYEEHGIPVYSSYINEPAAAAINPDVEIPESVVLSAMTAAELRSLIEKVDPSARVANKKDAIAFLEARR